MKDSILQKYSIEDMQGIHELRQLTFKPLLNKLAHEI